MAAAYDSGGLWGSADLGIGTGGGTDRVLIATWNAATTTTAPTGLTYGGQSMTEFVPLTQANGSSFNNHAKAYYLLESGIASATSANLALQGTSSGGGAFIWVSGGAQQVPNYTVDTQSGNPAGPYSIAAPSGVSTGDIIALTTHNTSTIDGTNHTYTPTATLVEASGGNGGALWYDTVSGSGAYDLTMGDTTIAGVVIIHASVGTANPFATKTKRRTGRRLYTNAY